MKIIYKNSPNHYNGRNGWKADVIVFHQTGGTSAADALKWYLNPNAQCSPNWVIDKDGTIYQLVHPNNAAYCNGTRTDPNQKLYYGLATSKLVRERKTNANFFTYSMEFVHCQWGNINQAQIDAAVELIKNIIIPNMRANGITPSLDRDHFIGHCEIDPITRAACPGKLFPYQTIIDMVAGKSVITQPSYNVEGKSANFAAIVKPNITSTSNKTTTFNANDKVKILATATTYAGVATKIPTAYKGDKITYTISKISGDRALIKELYSWVWIKDLKKV